MEPVLGAIPDVVDRVKTRGEHAKGHEGQPHSHGDIVMAERAGRPRRGHDESVLEPLVRAHRDQRGEQRTSAPSGRGQCLFSRVGWTERYDLGAVLWNL